MSSVIKIALLIAVNIACAAFVNVIACSCSETAPCQSYSNADVVFVGEVTGAKYQRTEEDYDGSGSRPKKITYDAGEIHFRVVEPFKGAAGRTQITIHSTMGGGDCGAVFERGKRYVIFASKDGIADTAKDSFQRYMLESQKLKPESSRLWTSICSGNMEFDAANGALDYLRNPPKAGDGGTIEGRIFQSIKRDAERQSAKPYFGLRIRAVEMSTGTEKASEITDENGRFRLQVPAGRYRIEPQLNEYLKVAGTGESDTLEVSVQDANCALRTLHITNNSLITGFVLDETGKKMSGLSLDLITAGKKDGEPGFASEWSYVSADEGFSFDGIPPGEYQLSLNYGDKPDDDDPYPTWFYPGTQDRSKATIFRIEEGTKLPPLVFKLPPKLRKASLSGIVVWKDGKPAVGAEVQLVDLESNKDMFFKQPVTDKNGHFVLESFADRRYKIKVIVWESSPDGNTKYGIADAETEEFRLDTTTPALRVELQTIDPRRKSITRYTGRAN